MNARSNGGEPVKRWLSGSLVLVGLLAVACGDGGSGAAGGHSHDMSAMEGSTMGEAADEAQADRTVAVEMSDELAYSPESIEVSEGEVVTFEVVNEGNTPHEFVLGDTAYQEAHESQMGAGHAAEMHNGVAVDPGESATFTWRFTEAGEVLYGCHVPGHYEGGMVGHIAVN